MTLRFLKLRHFPLDYQLRSCPRFLVRLHQSSHHHSSQKHDDNKNEHQLHRLEALSTREQLK